MHEKSEVVRNAKIDMDLLGVKKKKIEFDPNVMITVEEFVKERNELGDWKHASCNTGGVSVSVTRFFFFLLTK